MADAAPAPAAAPSTAPAPTPNPEPGTPARPETPPIAPPTPKFRVKVRGTEREVDADTYHAWAQKAAAGETGLEEVARQRKELEAEHAKAAAGRDRIKRETDAVLREGGVDPEEWAARYILERLGPEGQGLTHEQQQLRDAQEQLAKYQAQEKTTAEQAKQERLQKAALAKGKEYREKFAAGLAELGVAAGDPGIPSLIIRMAREQKQAEDDGIDLPPKALAELTMESMRAEQVTTWGRLEGDPLLAAIGPELERRVIAAAVTKHKRERARQDPVTGQPEPPGAPGQPRRANGTYASQGDGFSRERHEFEARLGIKSG